MQQRLDDHALSSPMYATSYNTKGSRETENILVTEGLELECVNMEAKEV